MNTPNTHQPEEITSLRTVNLLVARAPADFEAQAQLAQLAYSVEYAEWGKRFIVDFSDLSSANPKSRLVIHIAEIAHSNVAQSFAQICLESQ